MVWRLVLFIAEKLNKHPVNTFFSWYQQRRADCMKNNWICGSQSDIFSNLISVLFSELTRISLPGQNGNPLSLKQNGKWMTYYDLMITCSKKELWHVHDNSYKVNWSKMNDLMISWPIMIMIIMIKQDSWKITWPIPQDGGTGKPLWTRCLSKKFTIVITWLFDQRERSLRCI